VEPARKAPIVARTLRLILILLPWLVVAVGLACYFLPAHEIYSVRWNLCFGPDCKSLTTVSPTPWVDSYYDHHGPILIPVFIVGATIASFAVRARPRWYEALSFVVATLVWAGLTFSFSLDLEHMFDRCVDLPAGMIWQASIPALALLGVLNAPTAWLFRRHAESRR